MGLWEAGTGLPSILPSAVAPPILSCSSSLKIAHFLSCFADVKTLHQIEDVNYLRTLSIQPPASWSLRTDHVSPWPHDTSCNLTISQSDNCTSAYHTPCHPTPAPHSLAFKKCFAETLLGAQVMSFSGHEQPISLQDPAVNLALLQKKKLGFPTGLYF